MYPYAPLTTRAFFTTFWAKLQALFLERKFWVLLGALVTTWAAYYAAQITFPQALLATISSLSVYSTGVAIEGLKK